MVESLGLFLKSIPPEIATLIIGMTPISELRGAIPIAVGIYKLSLWEAFFWAAVGNILIATILVFFLEKVSEVLSRRSKFFKKFFNWLFTRTRKRAQGKIEKYGAWGLYFLVAIPLPMTGGWTGALAAFLFGLPKKKSILIIALGVLTAGIIVSLLTFGTGVMALR